MKTAYIIAEKMVGNNKATKATVVAAKDSNGNTVPMTRVEPSQPKWTWQQTLVYIIVAVLLVLVQALLIQLVWNAIIPKLTKGGLSKIGMSEAILLKLLIMFLFGH